jgi:branched-chain amino acid transport system ATP-binding protein
VLAVENLTVAYGGLTALAEVSLSVRAGQFVSIVGPNGAGKTTLFKAISGTVRPSGGRIRFEDQDLLAVPPAQRAHFGIARAWAT